MKYLIIFFILLLCITLPFLYFFLKENFKNISSNEKYLYCFVCNQKTKDFQLIRIKTMMEKLKLPYVICIGGYKKSDFDNKRKIIKLNCDDKYCGLPEKIVEMFNFILKNNYFNEFTHFAKLDEDMIITKPIDKVSDYMGFVQYTEGNRNYHIGKCPESKWNMVPYLGKFVPWCLGGRGYLISRKSAHIIANIEDKNEFMLEDVMIGLKLKEKNILPVNFKKIKDYINSIHPYTY